MASKGAVLAAKIVLVGDSGVGKTSLLARYVDEAFSESHVSTIGVDFKQKQVKSDGKFVNMTIWDTAGQERFRTITSSYYRGAKGVVVVYDVTQKRTFDRVEKWITEAMEYTVQEDTGAASQVNTSRVYPGIAIAIIGNKSDLKQREVTTEQGKNFAMSKRALFFETSASKGLEVDKAFQGLVDSIMETCAPLPIEDSRIRDLGAVGTACNCNGSSKKAAGCAC